jgi:EXS family
MDWGMMKTPAVAATMLCYPGGYAPLPTVTTQPPTKPLLRANSGSDGRSTTSCWYALLRSRLRYGVSVSIVILITDVVLRFSWMLRFWHQLFPSNDSFVLLSQFLEVIRRALWNLLRIEWEHMKQSGAVSSPPPVGTNGSSTDDASAASSFSLRVATGTKATATNKAKITTEKNAEA